MAADFFMVPTVGRLLFVLVMLAQYVGRKFGIKD